MVKCHRADADPWLGCGVGHTVLYSLLNYPRHVAFRSLQHHRAPCCRVRRGGDGAGDGPVLVLLDLLLPSALGGRRALIQPAWPRWFSSSNTKGSQRSNRQSCCNNLCFFKSLGSVPHGRAGERHRLTKRQRATFVTSAIAGTHFRRQRRVLDIVAVPKDVRESVRATRPVTMRLDGAAVFLVAA